MCDGAKAKWPIVGIAFWYSLGTSSTPVHDNSVCYENPSILAQHDGVRGLNNALREKHRKAQLGTQCDVLFARSWHDHVSGEKYAAVLTMLT